MPEMNILVDQADVVVSYSIYQTLQFKYKHLLVQTILKCDPNNEIKISAS